MRWPRTYLILDSYGSLLTQCPLGGGSSLAIAPHSVVSAPQVGNLGLEPLILEQCPCEHGVPHLLVDVGLRIGGALPLVLLVDVALRVGGALPLVLLRIPLVLGRKRLLGSRVRGLG